MKPLRFGLLGVGYFGRNYVRLLQQLDGVSLAAVAARTKESLAEIKGALPKSAAATTDVLSVLKNRDVDCVVIATPPSTHFALAVEALEHGKHVLVEKPMVASLSEARQLRAAVKKGSLTFMVGHQYVYNDYVRHLRSLVSQGVLGRVGYAFAEHLCFPVRQDIGSFWDAAPHPLSMLHYLFRPGKILGVTGRSVNVSALKKGFDDFTSATLRFSSGLAATLVTTWFGARKTRSLMLVGDKALAVFDDVEEKAKIRLFPGNKAPVVAAREPLRNEVEHFVECIRSNKEPLTGIGSSYEIIEWLDTVQKGVKK